jgi:hypothetical protein
MHTESTGENIASLNEAYETPKRTAEQGIKTFDFLGQLSSAEGKQPVGLTKTEYMKLLRDKRMHKFEEKRKQASNIILNRETLVLVKCGQVS